MSLLLSAHNIHKTMGDKNLFSGLSFGLHEKQKLGLLGPNGAGKSTLLKILAGKEEVDEGNVAPRKNLRLAFVEQEDQFDPEQTVLDVVQQALIESGVPNEQATVQASIHLGMAGFQDFKVPTKKLSGGWKKRLSLARAFAMEPEVLLLDEPTNHLDWDGILWLEGQLKIFDQSFLLISHDRDFLKNTCQHFMEVNRLYQNGFYIQQCSYEKFLESKQSYMENQISQQQSMANKARRETEWLRAGVQARTTKSQSRIKEAHQLLSDLDEVKSRNFAGQARVSIDIDSSGRKTKKLIELKSVDISWGDKKLIKDLDLILGPKNCLGILGDNASGKTSLLKVIAGFADNFSGEVFRADDLKIVYFDQKRDDLDPEKNLMEYLGDGSDHITFKGGSVHVASYASRFLFDSSRMNLPISRLSGGEQARLLIAKILLQPADVLILDEPTNDLDINTIEILENSLSDFPGLSILVSHDRYFLRNLCDRFIALDGQGGWHSYADVEQWLKARNQTQAPTQNTTAPQKTPEKKKNKVKLSYMDKRRFENIESEIATLEANLEEARLAVENNQKFDDHAHTQKLVDDMNECQEKVDEAFLFWQEMEEKLEQN